MFKIDPTTNRINPLEVKRFTDLGFTELKHLQKWLENYPQELAQGGGAELLIMQKELNGFEPSCARCAGLWPRTAEPVGYRLGKTKSALGWA